MSAATRQIAAGGPGDAGTEPSGLTGGPLPEVDAGGEHHDGAGDLVVGDAGQRGAKHQPSAAHWRGLSSGITVTAAVSPNHCRIGW